MVIDVLDGADLGRRSMRKKVVNEKKELTDWITGVKKAGIDPIIVYGTSNAIGHVVERIIDRARAHRTITLLRFHGHGAPGEMGIAGGKWTSASQHLSDFGPRRRRLARRTLSELRPYFASSGRVELHGCKVARGRAGRRLIRWLANTLGVPVSASLISQYDTGGPDTFTFEGPVLTAHPGGPIVGACY